MTFLTILGVTEIFYSFRLVLEGKTGREKPESSRLKFLWKFSSNNFTLSDAEYNTIFLVQTKKVISMNYGSSTSSWKPWRWVRLDLILSMRDIYISSNMNSLIKFTYSSRSSEFKDILPQNISKMITKTVSISTRIVISYAMKQGILL